MATAKKEKAPKEKKPAAPRKPRKKKNEADAKSRGLDAGELGGSAPSEVSSLTKAIEGDGGTVIGSYKDPLGGDWTILAGLPIDKVEPTPFQRDLSDTHVARLTAVIDKIDRFLDPVVTVRTNAGVYWTPNGNHRLHAMKRLGAKS